MRKTAVIFLTLVLACSRPSSDTAPAEMMFEVNPDLISGPVALNTLSLSFHPPLNWEPVPDSLFQRIRSGAAARTGRDGLVIDPAAVFMHGQNQSTLIISRVQTPEPMPLKDIADVLQNRSDYDQGGVRLKRDRFMKDGIKMEQLFMEDKLRVVIKLLFINPMGQAIQADFTTLKSEYQNESKAIESSIGTFLWTNS